jgi:predicted ribosome quality control (RQC) complex YloA/Tae2 family protein
MDDKRDFENRFAAKMEEWRRKVDDIKSKTEDVDTLNRLEFERQLDLLYAKYHLAEEKLKKLQHATETDSPELKASLDGIWNEIENALDSASAKIERFL